MQVLCALAANSNQTLSREALIDIVWKDVAVTDEVLTRCISQIRKALDACCPDNKKSEWQGKAVLQTIPKRGYRCTLESIEIVQQKKRFFTAVYSVAVSILVVLAGLGFYSELFFESERSEDPHKFSIAIFPPTFISNQPQSDQRDLYLSFLDQVSESMVRIPYLDVSNIYQVFDSRNLPALQQNLEVKEINFSDFHLVFSFEPKQESLSVKAHLKNRQNAHLWQANYDVNNFSSADYYQAELIEPVIRDLVQFLDDNRSDKAINGLLLSFRHKVSEKSRNQFLKAQRLIGTSELQNVKSGILLLEEILNDSPEFSDAISLLGFAYYESNLIRQSDLKLYNVIDTPLYTAESIQSLMVQALTIDSLNPIAKSYLINQDSIDWSAKELQLKQLATLNPGCGYCQIVIADHLKRLGKFEQALQFEQAALNFSPFRLKTYLNMAWTHILQGNPQQAQRLLTTAKQLSSWQDPNIDIMQGMAIAQAKFINQYRTNGHRNYFSRESFREFALDTLLQVKSSDDQQLIEYKSAAIAKNDPYWLVMLGESQLAEKALVKQLTDANFDQLMLLLALPEMEPMRNSSMVADALSKLKLIDYWTENGAPDICKSSQWLVICQKIKPKHES